MATAVKLNGHQHGDSHSRLAAVKGWIIGFIKKNVVMLIALVAAVVTMFFIPPDAEYLSYFDFKTLTCLFCTLLVVCALKNIRFFYMLAQKIVKLFKTTRACVLALVYVTFLGSMLIANDMALLTFLPLGYIVLKTTEKKKLMAFTFIMQNIAANLGGMLTPFGNPQNLYLYTKFEIPTGEFMGIMAIPFAVSVLLITVCCCIFVKPEAVEVHEEAIKPQPWRTVVYLMLFAFSIVIVFRWVHYLFGLLLIPLVILFMDRKAFKKVDYPLLLTFVFFFIFAGNMSRIESVRQLFSNLLEKNTLLVGIASCQCISNVPSAILLSQFTGNYRALLLGVNVGGVGTLISSLASLITFREYVKREPKKGLSYIGIFSAFNFAFLVILTLVSYFIA